MKHGSLQTSNLHVWYRIGKLGSFENYNTNTSKLAKIICLKHLYRFKSNSRQINIKTFFRPQNPKTPKPQNPIKVKIKFIQTVNIMERNKVSD